MKFLFSFVFVRILSFFLFPFHVYSRFSTKKNMRPLIGCQDQEPISDRIFVIILYETIKRQSWKVGSKYDPWPSQIIINLVGSFTKDERPIIYRGGWRGPERARRYSNRPDYVLLPAASHGPWPARRPPPRARPETRSEASPGVPCPVDQQQKTCLRLDSGQMIFCLCFSI